jgi:hypothetical protein
MDIHEQDCDGKFEREGDVFDEIPSGVLEGKETDFRVAEMMFLGRKSHLGKVNILKKWCVLVAQDGVGGETPK